MSSAPDATAEFHLLLAGPEQGDEALFEPDSHALELLPPIAPMPTPQSHLGDDGVDSNELAAQRWGLVLPGGQDMEPILRELEPLLKLRERQQRAPVRRYHVPPGLQGPAVHSWYQNSYEFDGTAELERPRYLLMIGGIDQLPLELQQVLSTHAWLGRLAFDRVEDYGHYARKVCRWAEASGQREAGAVFFSVRDGSRATQQGHPGLVLPCYEQMRTLKDSGRLPLAELLGPDDVGGAPEEFLAAAAKARPTVLLSMSHGRGAPKEGWASQDDQLSHQGAMRFGLGRMVSGKDVQACSFLPGGFWLYFACFGAGTPAVSSYGTWLELLRTKGFSREQIDRVVRTIEGPAPRPFMAALPQRVLANPKGPLGVIAHVDLTWSYAFRDPQDPKLSRAARFSEPLRLLASGTRVGIAAKKLALAASAVENRLVDMFAWRERGRQVDLAQLGHQWMLRQDLRSFILLGDPAARLPLRPDTSGAPF